MNPDTKNQISDPRLIIFGETEFDETSFYVPGEESPKISWQQIVRVAVCYEIHPVAVADWDYWAFQTNDPNLLLWVRITDTEQSKAFSREVGRRFGNVEVPPMKDWVDSDQNVRTYVIWPEADTGNTLYLLKKNHQWSPKGHLVHRTP